MRVNGPDTRQLQFNLGYGIVMARFKYRMTPMPLPPGDDVLQMARYWKRYYNTVNGRGRMEEFVGAWQRYVKERIPDFGGLIEFQFLYLVFTSKYLLFYPGFRLSQFF